MGHTICLTTKHNKQKAFAKPFQHILSAHVKECVMDTDKLGAFSGDIERSLSPLECVRQKCLWGLERTGVSFGIATEASFSYNHYLPVYKEIVYFIDKTRSLDLHITHISHKTNYATIDCHTFEELVSFANKVMFPTHGLILSADTDTHGRIYFKNIKSYNTLKTYYIQALNYSNSNIIYAQTDMRASFNPTRMNSLGEQAKRLAHRLNQYCPACKSPGWGITYYKVGRLCGECGSPTEEIASHIYGCTLCNYTEDIPINTLSSAKHCSRCNP